MKSNLQMFRTTMPVTTINTQMTIESQLDQILLLDPNKNLLEQTKHCFNNDDKTYFTVTSKARLLDMMKAGLVPYKRFNSNTIVYAREASRLQKYENHATHIVAMSSPKLVFGDAKTDKECKILIAMTNSYHNRTNLHFDLMLQLPHSRSFVLNLDLSKHKIKHSRGSINVDSQNILEVVKEKIADEVLPFILASKTTKLTKAEQKTLARRMLEIRLIPIDKHNPKNKEKFEKELQNIIQYTGSYNQLLKGHRAKDAGNSLWSVAMRIQENLGLNHRIPLDKDGNEYRVKYRKWSEGKNGNKVLRESTLKMVWAISETVRLNKALFTEMRILLEERESKVKAA